LVTAAGEDELRRRVSKALEPPGELCNAMWMKPGQSNLPLFSATKASEHHSKQSLRQEMSYEWEKNEIRESFTSLLIYGHSPPTILVISRVFGTWSAESTDWPRPLLVFFFFLLGELHSGTHLPTSSEANRDTWGRHWSKRNGRIWPMLDAALKHHLRTPATTQCLIQ
jgi:hypothetical protein